MQYEITSNEASAVVGLKGAMLNSLQNICGRATRSIGRVRHRFAFR